MFLLSSTHGAEAVGLAALLKTVEIFERDNVVEKNWQNGELLKNRIEDVIQKHNLGNYLKLRGYPCFMLMDTLNEDSEACNSLRTLLMQEMIAHAVLFQGLLFLTPSHGEEEINFTISAFDKACAVYAKAIEEGSVDDLLVGPPLKPVFRKIN